MPFATRLSNEGSKGAGEIGHLVGKSRVAREGDQFFVYGRVIGKRVFPLLADGAPGCVMAVCLCDTGQRTELFDQSRGAIPAAIVNVCDKGALIESATDVCTGMANLIAKAYLLMKVVNSSVVTRDDRRVFTLAVGSA